jgi:hypothetical protein
MFCPSVATFGIESARLLREYYTVCATRSCSHSGMRRPGGTASSSRAIVAPAWHRPQAYCSALLSVAPPHAAPAAACAPQARSVRIARGAAACTQRTPRHWAVRHTAAAQWREGAVGCSGWRWRSTTTATHGTCATGGTCCTSNQPRSRTARPPAREPRPRCIAVHCIALPFFTLQAPARFYHGALRRAGWRTRGTARRRGPSRLRRACTAWASSSRKCIGDSTRTHSSAAVVNRLAHSLPQTHARTHALRTAEILGKPLLAR